jgi:hypothetical protein
MKKMALKKVLLWVLVFAIAPLISSCDLEDDYAGFRFVNLQIVEAELPETFEVYKTYQVKVTYLRPNNCTFFEGFDVTKPGTTTRNVVAFGSELEDSACAQVTDEVVEYFNFTCYYHDTYIFRFWTGEDEEGNAVFLEYEVPVTSDPLSGSIN